MDRGVLMDKGVLMKKAHTFRSAFSMVELVFVIAILGIVSSIGAEIISQIYESYIVQRAQYRAASKTELAINQIANRLRYAIPGTVGFRPTLGGTFKGITEANNGNDTVLQWVAYDGDSFEAMTSTSRKPGWSGFCDIDASSSTSIVTPGSNMDLTTTIIGKLGGNINQARIYFPDNTSHAVASGTGEAITITAIPVGSNIYERYKLAWTSYALEVKANAATGKDDLILHYKFAPIVGQAIVGSSSVLLRDVTNFRFQGSEGSLRIKICKDEQIGMDVNDTIHACKEKVVF